MTMTRADIDRAARRAEANMRGAAKLDEWDLLKDGFPFRPALWNIVVEPIKARTVSDGGIVVPEMSTDADGIQTTVARVLKVGPAAFDGVTSSGIALKNFLPGVTCAEDLIGKFYFHQQHVGMILRLRKTDQQVKVMKLTDLLGETEDPQAWKFYV